MYVLNTVKFEVCQKQYQLTNSESIIHFYQQSYTTSNNRGGVR